LVIAIILVLVRIIGGRKPFWTSTINRSSDPLLACQDRPRGLGRAGERVAKTPGSVWSRNGVTTSRAVVQRSNQYSSQTRSKPLVKFYSFSVIKCGISLTKNLLEQRHI
jgi:hypothetical protein